MAEQSCPESVLLWFVWGSTFFMTILETQSFNTLKTSRCLEQLFTNYYADDIQYLQPKNHSIKIYKFQNKVMDYNAHSKDGMEKISIQKYILLFCFPLYNMTRQPLTRRLWKQCDVVIFP